jgi:hypothetical protein
MSGLSTAMKALSKSRVSWVLAKYLPLRSPSDLSRHW